MSENPDYKEILRNKAGRLRELLATYGDKIDESQRNEIQILIDNTLEITNGRLDALDYDVRDQAIMNYHDQLDRAMKQFDRFQEQEQEK